MLFVNVSFSEFETTEADVPGLFALFVSVSFSEFRTL